MVWMVAFAGQAEFDILGFLVPSWLAVGVLAYLLAWFLVALMERRQWTMHIWHLPLFFMALFGICFSVIGWILFP